MATISEMQTTILRADYEIYVFDCLVAGVRPMSMSDFLAEQA